MRPSNGVQVYFTNFGYYVDRKFASVAHAISYGMQVHFEFAVYVDDVLECAWSPLTGLRWFNRPVEAHEWEDAACQAI